MIDWERKKKQRIIFENKHYVAFVPYASRVSYEVRIFPKKHESHFENFLPVERPALAEALQKCLLKIKKAIGSPDYNFFIHTAPVGETDHYHWHIEILPRTFKWGGLELGMGIEVVAVPPEEAARNLREAK
jgi:UDPglucose--hexose-1-phosphate uridylyltransferase